MQFANHQLIKRRRKGGKNNMATLEELERENKALKTKIASERELAIIGRKRNELLRENKRLLREAKFGKQIRLAKRVGKSLGIGGEKLGRATVKGGIIVGKALIKQAKKIAEADRREELIRRGIKPRVRKKVVKRKTTRKKKR